MEQKEWKIGDECWVKCCCGPMFKILDITYGFAIINHLPEVAVRLEDLYPSKEEFIKEELNLLFIEEKELKERIVNKRNELRGKAKEVKEE